MVFIDQADLPWNLNTIPTLRHSEVLSILVEAGYIHFEMLQFEVPGEDGLIDHFVICPNLGESLEDWRGVDISGVVAICLFLEAVCIWCY